MAYLVVASSYMAQFGDSHVIILSYKMHLRYHTHIAERTAQETKTSYFQNTDVYSHAKSYMRELI